MEKTTVRSDSHVHIYFYWKNNERDGERDERLRLSVAPSLQDCPSHHSSLFVDGKVVILGIIQGFLDTLVEILQGDKVLGVLL